MARSEKWWWGLPLLAVLWLAAFWITTPEVEQDLQTRVGSAIDSASVAVAGRDVTLPNATSNIRDTATQTYGVRQVVGTLGDLPVAPADKEMGSPPEVVPPVPAVPPTSAVDASPAPPQSSTAVVDAKACEQQFATALNQYKVLFDTAQDILSPASQTALDALVATAKQCPDEQIEVDGYTDNTGNSAFNLGLSKRRAEAVASYLAKHGVTPEHLKAAGFGEANPVAPNDTPQGQAQNRRIEIKVTDDQAMTAPTDAK
ncbi:OmpA family protein [Pseudomonas gingeri]|uniref:OmpA family protein n=1 Tax=Pseudomonas gingeri TaxID=117681 RepID=UPI00159FC00A|nr:OmpA family protein [Pseudomonas gingeri]NWA28022.1 OmpA family protein [Pseudomonas gingeri]NWD70095.1 OmpA family protein [Pseudomonas gingeri]